MFTQRQPRHGTRGFSLTEIAIVLGIVGLILGSIWTAASAVYSNQRTNTTNTQIMQIVQGIRSLYASQPTTFPAGTDMTEALIDAGIIPTAMVFGKTIVGAWGGPIFVVSNADSKGFLVQISRVPQKNCIALVSSVGGASRDAGLVLARAVGSSDSAPGSVATAEPLTTSVVPTQAGTGCVAGLNSVQLGFLVQ